MTENEILGFDPTQLTVFAQNDSPKTSSNPLIYRTRPADSVSEDHVYRATIKVVYNPYNLRQSVLEQQSYGLQDENGWFTVVSSLTNQDTSCPIFKAWKKCHFANPKKDEQSRMLWKQAAKVEEGGNGLFDKRYARYVVVQVLEDKNQPEQVGKFLFWKMPKSVWDIINSKMAPSAESKKAKIPVMDFLFGRAIDIEVTPGPGKPGDDRYARETKYMAELSEDVVSCTNPDGSPLLDDAEQAVLDKYIDSMKSIWREKDPAVRASLEATVNADPNTIELRKIYAKVLEQIKGFCPDLVAELGYKPWTPEVSARVQAWIDKVLAGQNPAEQKNTAEDIKNVADAIAAPATPAPAPTAFGTTQDPPFTTATGDDTDDPPFTTAQAQATA